MKGEPLDPENPSDEEGFMEIGNHINFGHWLEDGATYLKDRRRKLDFLNINIRDVHGAVA